MNNKLFVFAICMTTLMSVNLYPKFKMLSLSRVKNKIESKIKQAREVTKENINNFVKKAKNKISDKMNIKRHIFSAETNLVNDIKKLKEELKWGNNNIFLKELEDAQKISKEKKNQVLYGKLNYEYKNNPIPALFFRQDLKSEAKRTNNLIERLNSFFMKNHTKTTKNNLVILENEYIELTNIYKNIEKLLLIINS